MKAVLFTMAALTLIGPAVAADPVGHWEGALEVGSIKLRLAFHIEKAADGKLTGTMDSPDQGAKGVPLGGVRVEGDTVTIDLAKFKAEFVGKFAGDGKKLAGEWKQAGRAFPLELARVETPSELRRPQMPTKPYPYVEEEVTIDHPAAGIKLAGTLTRPRDGGPFPAVVLVSGSGPQDRDETLFGHKPFLVIADHLTRNGFAVLRYDDRGVGKSTGDHGAATTADFATDAHTALKYLRGRADINPRRAGFLGHSEGAMIAPIVAAGRPDEVAFIVLLAPPGLPGDEILADQLVAILKAGGATEHELNLRRAMQQKLLAVGKQGGTKEEVTKKLVAAAREYLDSLRPEDRKLVEQDVKAEVDDFEPLVTPWMAHFVRYDPRPTLMKVKCPTLGLIGQYDLQVTPAANLPPLRRAFAEAGNNRVTLKEMPGLNHLFQRSKTGLPTEYATIEETFAPEALDEVTNWLKSVVTGG
jgi:pimeloyl-ACP methyl ester carboxylesterase